MALFKSLRGKRSNLPSTKTDGYAYFCTDDGTFHIDYTDDSGVVQRTQINAKDAETVNGHIVNVDVTTIANNILDGSTTGAVRTVDSELENDAYTMGIDAFAEGNNTAASGNYSHAAGNSTIADSKSEYVFGEYNLYSNAAYNEVIESGTTTISSTLFYYFADSYIFDEETGLFSFVNPTTAKVFTDDCVGKYFVRDMYDPTQLSSMEKIISATETTNVYNVKKYYRMNRQSSRGKYVHIIGNGTADTARSNAYTLDWSGNAWFAGTVKVGGTGYADTESKELATKECVDWDQIYDSGAITSEVNSISGIDIADYKSLMVAIKCVNTTNSTSTRSGAVIFTGSNGQDYAFNNIFSNLIKNGTTTSGAFAKFKIVDGFIICENAMRAITADGILSDTEGEGIDTLAPVSGGLIKCTNSLLTMAVSTAAQSADHYYGIGSRVIVWGCKA